MIKVAKRPETPPRRRGRIAIACFAAALTAGAVWWWRAEHPAVVVLQDYPPFAPRLRSVEFDRSDGYRKRFEWGADEVPRIRLPIPENDSEGYALRATRIDGSSVNGTLRVDFNRLTVVVLSATDCRYWTVRSP